VPDRALHVFADWKPLRNGGKQAPLFSNNHVFDHHGNTRTATSSLCYNDEHGTISGLVALTTQLLRFSPRTNSMATSGSGAEAGEARRSSIEKEPIVIRGHQDDDERPSRASSFNRLPDEIIQQ